MDYATSVRRARDERLEASERRHAFSELVIRFQDMAYACALGMLGDPMNAQDAAQEAFIGVWRHLHRLENPEAFPSWLRQRVVWRCWYYGRSRQQTADFPDDLIAQIPDAIDPEATMAQEDLNRKLHRLIETLPCNAREILTLHYLNEYSHAEIARFLNLTEGAVRKRLHDARHRLRVPLERMLGEAMLECVPSRKQTIGDLIMSERQIDSKRNPEEVIAGMIKPAWCEKTEEGKITWEMFCAAIHNDTDTLERHIAEDPARARFEFWYTPPIYFSAREGALEATRILWEAYPYEGVSKLIELADERGHTAVANYLRDRIEIGDDTDLRLHEAIEGEDEDEALRLIETEPNLVHQSDPDGNTPLHLAVLKLSRTLVGRLLDAGAPIDAMNHSGFRPVHHGYWEGRWPMLHDENAADLARLLLDRGARDSITLAAARGDMDAVKRYLSEDNTLANDGDTLEKRPISTAADRGDQEMVRLLIAHGADPKLQEGPSHPFGSALMRASVNDDVEMASLLLEAGADPNGYVDSSGTPTGRAVSDAMRGLMYAYGGIPGNAWGYIQQGNLEMIAMILTLDPDPFSENIVEYISTPYTAVVSGYERKKRSDESTQAHEAIFDMLIRKNFPMPEVLTECQFYMFTPGYMTRTLLEKGLNPSLPDWQRQTPLHHLADAAHSEPPALATADLLLEFGADIDAVDEAHLSTPLGIAAYRGNLAFVVHLLEKGADPNKAGTGWAKPLARAERRGHTEVAALLREHGAA